MIFADCCSHDASCMLWKKEGKKKKPKKTKLSRFVQVVYMYGKKLLKINKDTVVNTHTELLSFSLSFLRGEDHTVPS